MSAKQAKRSLRAQDIDVSSFLRSINLCFDAAHPERIEHFRPTAKCVRLLTALSGHEDERAFFVVAPYGTGKSIAASYLLQLVENRPDAAAVLRTVEDRMLNVNSAFAEFASNRRLRKKRGIAIALQGYCSSLPAAIQEAIGESMDRLRLGRQARPIMSQGAQSTEDIIAMLKTLLSKAEQEKCDRVVLIWDEFGRHLESLVAEGRTSKLNDIQTIAEFASRSTKVSLTIGLILHQDLFNYASNLPQSVRSEWKKIEGRFQNLQYVDLSRETYSLIADLIAARRTPAAPNTSLIKKAARAFKEAGLFADFSQKDLAELLERSYPLEPAALWALPRIAARVAQNERTLFGFLGAVDLRAPVTPATVFDYFSGLMQADIGVGGTYKKWLETQAAIERASDIDGGAEALKTIAVMGFNVSSQRGVVSSGLADLALAGYTRQVQATSVRKSLLVRKLLLHRKHSDEVSIWHGVDIDLRGLLEDEKNRQRLAFDLFGFLRKEAPLSVWRPTRYNDEYRMQRYFRCSYVSHQDLHNYLGGNLSAKLIADTCDGMVLYYVPESPEQLAEAEAIVRASLRQNRILIALPRQVTALKEACLEVWSLVSLQGNQDGRVRSFGASRTAPMTEPTRARTWTAAQALTSPRADGPRWYHIGSEHQLDSPGPAILLSSIMEEVYSLTPKLNNEAIVRQQPGSYVVMVNSRKKLEIGILERSGTAKMGIEGDFPDASMFFTILLDTGIYRQAKGDMYRYARPQEIDDPDSARSGRGLRTFS
ncbi:MAG: hypothetical protein IPH09_16485 [bacterium]|nr:hypothetical protein [bacterium]